MHIKTLITKNLGIFLCLFLAGCITAPKSVVNDLVSLPETWVGEASPTASTIKTPCLDYFEDNTELKTLINKAIEFNSDLAVASARVELAKAELKESKPNRLPTLNAGTQGGRQKINSFGPQQNIGGIIFDSYALNLGLKWDIDLWGSLKNKSQYQLSKLASAEANLESAKISIAAKITKIWLQVMHLKGQHLLLNQALDAQIMITDSTRERYIKGVTFVEDLLKENANQFALSEEIHTLKMQIDQSTRSLEILVGAYPNAEALAYTELPELPESVPAGIPSSLLSNRPDIISAERNLASANVLVKTTQKSRLPQISITGNSGTSSSDLSDLLKSDFSVWSVGSSIVMPLINHGKIKASIKQAKAGRLEAEAYYDSTVLNAFMEVENGLANEAYLKKERALNNQQLQQALSVFEISQSKYIKGSADFRMYLNTHLNALKSQRLNLQMKHEQLQNRINLYLALGYSFI